MAAAGALQFLRGITRIPQQSYIKCPEAQEDLERKSKKQSKGTAAQTGASPGCLCHFLDHECPAISLILHETLSLWHLEKFTFCIQSKVSNAFTITSTQSGEQGAEADREKKGEGIPWV